MTSDFQSTCKEIVQNLQNKNYKTALTLILPLLDVSAKDEYKLGGAGVVGERFKKLFEENKDFIFWFNSGCCLLVIEDINFGDSSFVSILYSLRNNLIHDSSFGNVDFVENGLIYSNQDNKHIFNINLILALLIVIAYLPSNLRRFPNGINFDLKGKHIILDSIRGRGKEDTFRFLTAALDIKD